MEDWEWFREASTHSPLMIRGFDTRPECTYVNAAWLAFTGRQMSAEAGDGWRTSIHPDDLAGVIAAYGEALCDYRAITLDYRVLNTSGKYRWISEKTTPLYRLNSIIGLVASAFDIDEQIMTHRKLERLVRDHSRWLRDALRREKELSSIKSKFISMASHELRTPLTTVVSSADLAQTYLEMDQPGNLTKHLQRIKSSVNYITTILDEFLSLEKLEQGEVSPESREIDLGMLVKDTLDELQGTLKQGQFIRATFKGKTLVNTDRSIVKSIVLNLVSNAIKYSRSTVKVSTKIGRSSIVITVSDQGIGIPEAERKHLFTRFFRASNVGTEKGTGLGLTIVQRYVSILGGTIRFRTSGRGTTFSVQIPLCQGHTISPAQNFPSGG